MVQVEVIAAGPDDDQRADEPAHHQHPAQPGHPLAQRQRGQQRDDQRRDHHDGGELAHRHVLEAEEGEQAGAQQQQAAQKLEFGVGGAQKRDMPREGSTAIVVAIAWKA
jgi:hypothetical protein